MELKLSQETIKAAIQAIGLGEKAHAAYRTAADRLRGDGITSEALEGDAKVKAMIHSQIIVASFSAHDRAIYERPTNSLSDSEKVTKRYVADQMRKRYNVILKYVRTAEKDETLDDESRATRAASTFEARCRKEAENRIAAIQKRENLMFDAARAITHLRAYLEVINKG